MCIYLCKSSAEESTELSPTSMERMTRIWVQVSYDVTHIRLTVMISRLSIHPSPAALSCSGEIDKCLWDSRNSAVCKAHTSAKHIPRTLPWLGLEALECTNAGGC